MYLPDAQSMRIPLSALLSAPLFSPARQPPPQRPPATRWPPAKKPTPERKALDMQKGAAGIELLDTDALSCLLAVAAAGRAGAEAYPSIAATCKAWESGMSGLRSSIRKGLLNLGVIDGDCPTLEGAGSQPPIDPKLDPKQEKELHQCAACLASPCFFRFINSVLTATRVFVFRWATRLGIKAGQQIAVGNLGMVSFFCSYRYL